VLETLECNLEFLEPHISKTSWTACVGALEGKWDNLRDYSVEKGVHFLGLCRLMGNERL
jgi:hypothetical protein